MSKLIEFVENEDDGIESLNPEDFPLTNEGEPPADPVEVVSSALNSVQEITDGLTQLLKSLKSDSIKVESEQIEAIFNQMVKVSGYFGRNKSLLHQQVSQNACCLNGRWFNCDYSQVTRCKLCPKSMCLMHNMPEFEDVCLFCFLVMVDRQVESYQSTLDMLSSNGLCCQTNGLQDCEYDEMFNCCKCGRILCKNHTELSPTSSSDTVFDFICFFCHLRWGHEVAHKPCTKCHKMNFDCDCDYGQVNSSLQIQQCASCNKHKLLDNMVMYRRTTNDLTQSECLLCCPGCFLILISKDFMMRYKDMQDVLKL